MIYLLTHEREVLKRSNTGQIATQIAPDDVKVILWARKEPHLELLNLIEQGKVALVYPTEEGEEDNSSDGSKGFEHFIVLDATWQEARKIFNKSPYLKALPRIHIKTDGPSRFTLRRNQVEGGLCTAEVVAHLLAQNGQTQTSEAISEALGQFIDTYHHR